jgi:hypothetical protein
MLSSLCGGAAGFLSVGDFFQSYLCWMEMKFLA